MPRPTGMPSARAWRALSMMPSQTMSPLTFCTSVEWVFSGGSLTKGRAGEIVQVTDAGLPASCVAAEPW